MNLLIQESEEVCFKTIPSSCVVALHEELVAWADVEKSF